MQIPSTLPTALPLPYEALGKQQGEADHQRYLEEVLGFKVTARTLAYIERRLDEVGFAEPLPQILHDVLTEDRILEFKAIFSETLNLIPFSNEKERNIDVINAFNFAIFDELQGKRIAQEGLRSVLRWRKERSKC